MKADSRHSRFKFKDGEALLKKAEELDLDLPFSENLGVLFEPVEIAGKRLSNRFAVHPMEGFDAQEDGSPSELTFRRYRRFTGGGSSLIWFEATAVVREARSNPSQLWIHKKNMDAYKRLADEARLHAKDHTGKSHDPFLVLQLTHSGRYSKPDGKPAPIIAHHSEVLDPVHHLSRRHPLITDEELNALEMRFVEAAELARQAGFDGVDIKSCHRYLVSELLASFTRRNSRYGGSFENRIRFLLETAGLIKQEVDIMVTSRLNAYDAIPYPYGFGVDRTDVMKPDLSEVKSLIQRLVEIGYPLLNVTVGNPYYHPQFNRPFDFPVTGGSIPDEHPLEGVMRLIRITGDLQKSFPALPVVATGYAWLRHFFPYVAAGVLEKKMATLVGQGRGAFAYPDSPRDIASGGGMNPHRVCITCSACTEIMRMGGRTGCVIRDKEIYSQEYRNLRKKASDILKREAERCRDCDSAMCQLACPAGLDIPGFIRAFAQGKMDDAYSIIAEKNLFPEMCAMICPVEVQCQGACIEGLLTGNPISIAGIQREIARKARQMGLSALHIPPKSSGKKIAVIGAGPAGIACAAALIRKGHSVDIFEKSRVLGGIPGTVIPFQRLDSAIVLEEVKSLLDTAAAGGRLYIHYGNSLSKKRDLLYYKNQYDAVFLGFGLPVSMSLPTATTHPEGVEDALTFLTRMKSGVNTSVGRTVAVLGGGNTALDAAATARGTGAEVYLIYRRSLIEMPAWPDERKKAMDMGIHFLILSQPVDYVQENGRLSGVKILHTCLGEPDASGRRSPVPVKGSDYILAVDHVIEALGQRIGEDTKIAMADIETDSKGWIRVDSLFRTSLEGVYAGGDVTNGGTTAVRAVSEGMKAASSIHRALMNGE